MYPLSRTEMCSPHKVNPRGLGKGMPVRPALAPPDLLQKLPGAQKSPTRAVVARNGAVCSVPRRNLTAALLARESLCPAGLARIRGRDCHPDDLGTPRCNGWPAGLARTGLHFANALAAELESLRRRFSAAQ